MLPHQPVRITAVPQRLRVSNIDTDIESENQ